MHAISVCVFVSLQINLLCARLLRYSASPHILWRLGKANKFALRSASAIFGFAAYTVHASAKQINLLCARLLRIFAIWNEILTK